MKHFAGDVTYCVTGWLDKNNDKLSEDYEKYLANATKELARDHLSKKEEEESAERFAERVVRLAAAGDVAALHDLHDDDSHGAADTRVFDAALPGDRDWDDFFQTDAARDCGVCAAAPPAGRGLY